MCRTKKSTLLTSLPLRLMSAHTVCGQYLKFISSQPIHLYSSWSFCSSFLSLGVSSVTEHSAQTLFNTVILSLSFLMTLYCQNLYFFPKVFFFGRMVLLLFGFDVWGFCFPLFFGKFDISYWWWTGQHLQWWQWWWWFLACWLRQWYTIVGSLSALDGVCVSRTVFGCGDDSISGEVREIILSGSILSEYSPCKKFLAFCCQD